MKLPTLPFSLAVVFVCLVSAAPAGAQKRRSQSQPQIETAVVIDERLSVLRAKPGLYSDQLQRLRRGRVVRIVGRADADGVRFYKVAASANRVGWVQSEAIFARSRPADELRLFRMIDASDGFERIELAIEFLRLYPESTLRPPLLLLFGDIVEDAAAKLSRDAGSRLKRNEMTAGGAPVYSYYLNFNMLDRYRRLGIRFLFNASTRTFHYDGASWYELVRKHPKSKGTSDAKKRLDSLKINLERTTASQ